ncbi:MAG: rhomboid family intramembrane serine protease [Spirochaetaceae bacterium]
MRSHYLQGVTGNSIIRKPLPYRQFNAALILIGINVFVFFVNQIAPQTVFLIAMNPAAVMDRGLFWQPFTYMFAHAGITHILFNMLGIFFFGTQVEARLGSYEFLLFFGLTGLLAGLFSLGFYMMTGNAGVILLGASGAVFAVLLAFATLFPDAMIYLFGIIPVRAPILVIGYTFIEIYSQVGGAGGNVAHFTHLAGFFFAFLYFVIRLRINPIRVFLEDMRS